MHYKGHQVGILSFVCNKEKRIQSRAQNKCFFVGLFRRGRGQWGAWLAAGGRRQWEKN